MLNINLDYDWIMGEPVKVLITKRQSPLMGENTFVIANWVGVSLTTPSLLPPALNTCYAGYIDDDDSYFCCLMTSMKGNFQNSIWALSSRPNFEIQLMVKIIIMWLSPNVFIKFGIDRLNTCWKVRYFFC